MKKQLTYTIPQGMECTLQEALRGRMGLTCRQVRSAKFRDNGILVNGERSRVSRLLHEGDLICVLLEDAHVPSDVHGVFNSAVSSPEPDILYEDEDLLVVNKPAGMCVHPSHGHHGDTLADLVFARSIRQGDVEIPRIIGRLDKDTSGLVLFARNKAAAQRLFEKDLVQKEYLALAQGKICAEPDSFTISCPIARDPDHKGKMIPDPDNINGGKSACTHVRILGYEEGNSADLPLSGDGFTILSVTLETGRTHQIRVHLSYIGHPLLGDPLYGSDKNAELLPISRAALHCYRMKITQPFIGKKIDLEAPIPNDFKSIHNPGL